MGEGYAIIGKPKYEPIEGARTLKRAFFEGLSYAVGLDTPEDSLVVIFTPDGQLSPEYAEANNCVEKRDPVTGIRSGGFFGKNRKVRTLSLMQGKIKSAGYIAPLESLAFTGYDLSLLKAGDIVDTLNGFRVANKFVVPHKGKGTGPAARIQMRGIPEHPDTKQLMRYIEDLPKGALLTLTLKLHGTSARIANAYQPIPDDLTTELVLRFAESHLPGLHFYINDEVAGTRRVILSETTGDGFYGTHGPWLSVKKYLEGKLLPGECLYGELVGYAGPGMPIQKTGGVVFDYGLPDGHCKFYVYNIKMTHPNGWSFDLPWHTIKARVAELNLNYVPEMVTTFIYNGDSAALETLALGLVDGPDLLGNHIREGLCVRAEYEGQVKFYKFKSQDFYGLEDKSKSDGETDIEEINDDSW